MKGFVHTNLIRTFLVLLLLGAYTFVFSQLKEYRTSVNRATNLRVPSLPPPMSSILAGEFQGLTADFLYLDIAATLGALKTDSMSSAGWDGIEKMFATAVYLDPYFSPTFRAAQSYLSWNAKRPESAIQILLKVSAKRIWDWLPPYFIGFDYYFFLNDPRSASKFFLAASEKEDAPEILATFGARLAAESGEIEMGIDFLSRLLKTKETENERKSIQQRISALQGMVELTSLIDRYYSDHGVYPPSLHDLVFLRYTKDLPVNPYYDNFFYQDGIIRFDPFPPNKN